MDSLRAGLAAASTETEVLSALADGHQDLDAEDGRNQFQQLVDLITQLELRKVHILLSAPHLGAQPSVSRLHPLLQVLFTQVHTFKPSKGWFDQFDDYIASAAPSSTSVFTILRDILRSSANKGALVGLLAESRRFLGRVVRAVASPDLSDDWGLEELLIEASVESDQRHTSGKCIIDVLGETIAQVRAELSDPLAISKLIQFKEDLHQSAAQAHLEGCDDTKALVARLPTQQGLHVHISPIIWQRLLLECDETSLISSRLSAEVVRSLTDSLSLWTHLAQTRAQLQQYATLPPAKKQKLKEALEAQWALSHTAFASVCRNLFFFAHSAGCLSQFITDNRLLCLVMKAQTFGPEIDARVDKLLGTCPAGTQILFQMKPSASPSPQKPPPPSKPTPSPLRPTQSVLALSPPKVVLTTDSPEPTQSAVNISGPSYIEPDYIAALAKYATRAKLDQTQRTLLHTAIAAYNQKPPPKTLFASPKEIVNLFFASMLVSFKGQIDSQEPAAETERLQAFVGMCNILTSLSRFPALMKEVIDWKRTPQETQPAALVLSVDCTRGLLKKIETAKAGTAEDLIRLYCQAIKLISRVFLLTLRETQYGHLNVTVNILSNIVHTAWKYSNKLNNAQREDIARLPVGILTYFIALECSVPEARPDPQLFLPPKNPLSASLRLLQPNSCPVLARWSAGRQQHLNAGGCLRAMVAVLDPQREQSVKNLESVALAIEKLDWVQWQVTDRAMLIFPDLIAKAMTLHADHPTTQPYLQVVCRILIGLLNKSPNPPELTLEQATHLVSLSIAKNSVEASAAVLDLFTKLSSSAAAVEVFFDPRVGLLGHFVRLVAAGPAFLNSNLPIHCCKLVLLATNTSRQFRETDANHRVTIQYLTDLLTGIAGLSQLAKPAVIQGALNLASRLAQDAAFSFFIANKFPVAQRLQEIRDKVQAAGLGQSKLQTFDKVIAACKTVAQRA